MILTPEELRSAISNKFPTNATCWSQATDEIRDMAREARGLLRLDEFHAVDFRLLRSPAAWNTEGIDGIIKFYGMMDDELKQYFIGHFKHFWSDEEE